MSRLAARCTAIAVSACLLAGCASVDSLKQARGEGVKRTFRHSYDHVFMATMDAAVQKKLTVVTSDRKNGTILLMSGASLSSLGGERIALFLTRLDEQATSVEVVVQAVVPGVSFPPDWAELLFGEIEENLAEQRLSQ